MKRAVLAIAAALLLAGCGGDQPVPERGLVTDADYSPEWMQLLPMTNCSGNPPICNTTYVPIFHAEEWRLTITDLSNHDWTGTVEVDQRVYDQCNLRELWPECSQEGAGDMRPTDAR
ncbi:hypothetical protein SEA_ZENTENO07_94 [Mycobacterium phage Zenteno07]|nr:hypothetical protein SEA_ZENTENO07_94 [Mycobacterium phage Zenteno07]